MHTVICTPYIDPIGLRALLSCWLIALNKNPGIHPIAIGESCRRIMCKAVLSVLKPDILDIMESVQLCAGQRGGCEAAVHCMRHVFQLGSAEAILLVDASNAFKALNRQACSIRNILHLCPSIAQFLINTYRNQSDLFIGGRVLISQKGIMQRDTLGMIMYAIATVPLIKSLNSTEIVQTWYADDVSAAGSLLKSPLMGELPAHSRPKI